MQINVKKQAIKGAMQCLYWLVHSEVPHTTKYGSLVDAVHYRGCNYSKVLAMLKMPSTKSQR